MLLESIPEMICFFLETMGKKDTTPISNQGCLSLVGKIQFQYQEFMICWKIQLPWLGGGVLLIMEQR